MSKRLAIVAGLIAIPLLAAAILNLRPGASTATAQSQAVVPLPEAIANLQRDIDQGLTTLRFAEQRGYLSSLLENLKIPVTSQTLVFGKNSAQLFLISPETPRALYFNDDVYVGYVLGAPHLEIASVDPVAGPVFYTLDQVEMAKPQFTLQPTDCLACHDTFQSDQPVPRLLMLSVLSDSMGVALNRSAVITNDKSPFAERWGGWYVTGTHGAQRHMGNRFVTEPAASLGPIPEYAKRADLSNGANVTDLSKKLNTTPYLTGDSDIVALMVLGHQTHIHNLITVAGTNLRANPPASTVEDEVEPLVDAMLFSEAVPLGSPVKGTTRFATEFSARGPHDSKGRSLYELDLTTRLLRYPLSYLVYSKSFDALPQPAKNYAYRRFWQILSGKDASEKFARLSPESRRAILDILMETKPDFAAFARQLE